MKNSIPLIAFLLLLSIGLFASQIVEAKPSAADGDFHTYFPLISRPIPPTWIGPEGGKIVSMVIDPIHPDTLYAGTWGVGVFKTTNGGTDWYTVNNGLGNTFIYSLAINPLQPDILYAGTYRGKLYKSLNGGASWFSSSEGIQAEAIVYAIAINPVNPNQVYIATRGISNNGNPPWNGIVYRSMDGGASWQIVLKDVPSLYQQDWAYALTILPTSPKYIYAAMHESGILYSDDYGISWYTANEGLPNEGGDIRSTRDIVIDSSRNPFYAFTGFWHGSGVYKSTDNVSAWIPTDTSIAGVKIIRLTLDPNQTDTIYLSTQSYHGIIKSINGGDQWFQSGLPDKIIWNVIVNPQNSQVLYSGTDAYGVYKSTNAGSSWFHAQKGILNLSSTGVVTLLGDPNLLYVSTLGQGVLKTNDHGNTWSEYNLNLNDRSIHALVQHPTNPGLVYALGDTGGLYSTNISLGDGWTPSSVGLPTTGLSISAFEKGHPFSSISVVDEEVSEPVFKTGTNTPTVAYNPLLCMSFAPSNPNIVYLGTAGAGIYKSSDGAASWSPAGLTGQSIWSLAVDPVDPKLVYTATDTPGGVKVSHDDGIVWEDLSIGTLKVYSLVFSNSFPATLYAGTSSGLYQWVEGFGWVNRGLAGKNVTVIATRSSNPNTLYIGTDDGTYTYDKNSYAWITGPAELLGHTIQAINFDLNHDVKGYFSTSAQGVLLAQIK